ncbi:hypothetical protein CLCR_00914 [Cladophialophora carrionii]|uniref:Zn(2)-C6 fungal-type domain-containing protein n=1 Tax=Cladophialophora carrionii TaxID=86049 RepID=A0A1C1D0Y9_9EURO|nr:hypothetical protein CLCR_00914 [Cladophialophora carrionii]
MTDHRPDAAGQRPRKKQRIHQARRYGFACSNCRRKKARCDGAIPTCNKCIATRESCEYDRGPSVAYAISLENRLKEFEDRFERLRRSTSTEELQALISKPFERAKPERARRASADAREPKDALDEGLDVEAADSSPLIQGEPPDEASVGVDGRICFYGKTSHYHVGPREDEDDEGTLPRSSEQRERQTTDQQQPMSSASTIYTTPDVNAPIESPGPPEVLSEIPSEFLDHLLDAYWCWAHHLHLVLNKRLFLSTCLNGVAMSWRKADTVQGTCSFPGHG